MKKYSIILFLMIGFGHVYAEENQEIPTSLSQFRYQSNEQLVLQAQSGAESETEVPTFTQPKLNMGKAVLLSAMLPGAGQIYAGDNWQGYVYMGIEAAAWALAISYNMQGKDKDKEFKRFADQNWNEAVYRDMEYSLATNPDPSINRQSPNHFLGDRDVWNALPWTGGSDNKSKYLPNNFTHELPRDRSQQFYEMIGKYLTQFGFGWVDQNQDNTTTIGLWDGHSGYANNYADMRYKSNQLLEMSNNMFMAVMLNHVVSAVHAALSVQKKNTSMVETSFGFQSRIIQGQVITMPTLSVKF